MQRIGLRFLVDFLHLVSPSSQSAVSTCSRDSSFPSFFSNHYKHRTTTSMSRHRAVRNLDLDEELADDVGYDSDPYGEFACLSLSPR